MQNITDLIMDHHHRQPHMILNAKRRGAQYATFGGGGNCSYWLHQPLIIAHFNLPLPSLSFLSWCAVVVTISQWAFLGYLYGWRLRFNWWGVSLFPSRPSLYFCVFLLYFCVFLLYFCVFLLYFFVFLWVKTSPGGEEWANFRPGHLCIQDQAVYGSYLQPPVVWDVYTFGEEQNVYVNVGLY